MFIFSFSRFSCVSILLQNRYFFKKKRAFLFAASVAILTCPSSFCQYFSNEKPLGQFCLRGSSVFGVYQADERVHDRSHKACGGLGGLLGSTGRRSLFGFARHLTVREKRKSSFRFAAIGQLADEMSPPFVELLQVWEGTHQNFTFVNFARQRKAEPGLPLKRLQIKKKTIPALAREKFSVLATAYSSILYTTAPSFVTSSTLMATSSPFFPFSTGR